MFAHNVVANWKSQKQFKKQNTTQEAKILSEIVKLEDRRTCQTSTAAAEMHYQAIFNSLSADNPICEVPDRTRHNGSGGRVLRHNVQIANQLPVHTVGFLFPPLGSSSSSFFPSPLLSSPPVFSRLESCSRDIAQSLAACFLNR